MSYLVLARKYRPQTFGQILGQDPVVTTLKNAITMERVAHAYLFSGPRGVGKTSTARVFAKALNCKKGLTVEPCDECVNCTEISAGTNLDVMEIDGASNRGIDQVRELRDNVKFSPASSRYKIYIIDEVHMLTTEAFNALLKTLEEPPAHVKFFFATTEPHRVPTTILSRCQCFNLRKISTQRVFENLKEIAKAEKIKAQDKTLFAIAKAADGSLRDAEGLLDQLISFSSGDLRHEDALFCLGSLAREEMIEFVRAIQAGDWKKLFEMIQEMDVEGKDPYVLINEMVSHFRDLLLLNVNPGETGLIELTADELKQVAAQSALFEKNQILQMLEVSLETEDRMRFAVSKRALLEALAVRLYLVGQSVTLDSLITRLDSVSIGVSGVKAQPKGANPMPPVMIRDRGLSQSKEELVKKNAIMPTPSPRIDTQDLSSSDPWEKLLGKIGEKKPLLQAYLKEAHPLWEETRVKLVFPANKSFCMENLKSRDHQQVIISALDEIFGKSFSLQLELAAIGDINPPTDAAKSDSSGSDAMQDDPLIRKALEIFQGKITDIKI